MIIEYEAKAEKEKENLIERFYLYKIVINRLENVIIKYPNLVDTKKTINIDGKDHSIYCRHYNSSLPQYTIALYFIHNEDKIRIIKVDYLS